MFCPFDIYNNSKGVLKESRREVSKEGHTGTVYELNSPDGISFGYYNVSSSQDGQVIIRNQQPFIQLSHTVHGRKTYSVDNGERQLVSFADYEYNYLFLNKQDIYLNWKAGEQIEIFELGISPEIFFQYLPEDHPFFTVLKGSMQEDVATPMSNFNLPLSGMFTDMLYQILHCPLEGRYKRLYVKSKIIELLAFQLEQYEQLSNTNGTPAEPPMRPEDRERMYRVRDIILANLDSPCLLIDLAHEVGTNETYLKKYFKQVFNNTVFGYLQAAKMQQAKELLMQGKSVAVVADKTGYKHAAHFARAFKKHFGYPPTATKK
jgi:AraC-like DNA-binding protein